ncbi:ECF transporter S component [Paratissierella segnis]|uniref:ECF transporter S component n=1 Tax=Paratissierella segnis TaxID=2763679 RepID=A0A926IF03_9FIRM|nr:ECF transporter S component [Paratissierella segnis]MBC8587952.1 ECF transporter S component [Paratissierella segnis]
MNKNSKFNVRKLTIIAILGAISAVFGMTPLGFIPVGPTRATIMHIPVIIGAIMEGPVVGGCVGLIFGLFSIFQAITNPTPVSFVFLNPLVSILPRVLIGIFTYYVYNALRKIGNKKTMGILYVLWILIILYLGNGIYIDIVEKKPIYLLLTNVALIILTLILAYFTHKNLKRSSLDIIISTIIGTLTNTVGVLIMIYFFYGEKFVEALGQDISIARKVIFGIGITNGIPEIIIAIIIVTVVVGALKKETNDRR